ncbi:MAG TPA: hypothetical protein VJ821_05535 [Anaerolineales bacterium]|nr:hypothetical protein [Anaerolineales bacterium]
MHPTDHLTDVQLNEYLDNEIPDRAQLELHLSSCADCAARFSALQALFHEIESLPDVALSKSLAASITRRVGGPVSLPRSLRLTVILQCVAAMAALIFTAPLVRRLISPYLSGLRVPSLAKTSLQIQLQWTSWLDMLSQLQWPALPQLPMIELSSLAIILTVAGVSILWLIGNGVLLRNQTK